MTIDELKELKEMLCKEWNSADKELNEQSIVKLKSLIDAEIERQNTGKAEWYGWNTSCYLGQDDSGEPRYSDRTYYRCSKCRNGSAIQYKYCPKCGCEMGKDSRKRSYE